jgi:hypothetical protein
MANRNQEVQMTTMKLKIPALLASLFAVAALSGPVLTASAQAHSASHRTTHKRHHHRRHPTRIPQHNGGDHDADNNGGPSDGDGNV